MEDGNLTKDGARLQAFLKLRQLYGDRAGPNKLVIRDDAIIERPWGWAFDYSTQGCLDGDMGYATGGNVPVIVNRFTGEVCLASIEKYEDKLRNG
jgi:hypothetical protein